MTRFLTGPALAGAGIATALLFFAGLAADVPSLRLAVKPVPALALAVWVARGCDRPIGRLTSAGLLLSALGDLLLEIGLFLPGLASFLAAHVSYVLAFLSVDRRPALGRALPFAAWGLGMLAVLRPGLGTMAPPVAAYVVVICVMMWRAAARVGSPATPALAALVGLLGALAFGASDSLIALDRFVEPIRGVRWPIMVLYWLGQAGIASSAVLGCGMLRRQAPDE